ncbi:hypothetical protein [Devosia sp.]|uniref:hypothetical protein n=1 Tax=Devosia sp. TaxID=1871048 RepID=UPI001AC7A4E1|nr:hypothetical protein [Devosia sp.]MBN9333853.1 hypothetical protein [Devosia sp.]
MDRKIKGFKAANVVSAFTETGTDGSWNDIDAPRNAPAKSPLLHLDKVAFHSSFYLYEVALDQSVTLTHPAIAGGSAGKEGFWSGATNMLTWEIFGRVDKTDHLLLAHGLPYTPLVMVAYQDTMVVAGTIVQNETAGTRFVGVSADASNVYLTAVGYSSDLTLAAVNRTYRVLVFRTPAPDPLLPLFSGDASGFQFGRGMVNSSADYLRRDTSSSPLDMDLGQTIDIGNGGARVVTGGNVQTDQFYSGSFAGSAFIPVNV